MNTPTSTSNVNTTTTTSYTTVISTVSYSNDTADVNNRQTTIQQRKQRTANSTNKVTKHPNPINSNTEISKTKQSNVNAASQDESPKREINLEKISALSLCNEKVNFYEEGVSILQNEYKKMRSDFKSAYTMMCKDLRSAVIELRNKQSEIDFIKKKAIESSSVLDTSMQSISTYAQIASNASINNQLPSHKQTNTRIDVQQNKRNFNHSEMLIISSTEDAETDLNQIKNKLRTHREDAHLKITKCKATGKCYVNVKTDDSSVIDSVKSALDQIDKATVINKPKLQTQLKIKFVEDYLTNQQILDDLHKLNNISTENTKILFSASNKVKSFKTVYLTDSDENMIHLLSAKRVRIGFNTCKVELDEDITICSNCSGYNHKGFKKNSRVCLKESICNNCSGAHCTSNCNQYKNKDEWKCINCVNAGEQLTNHRANDKSCPQLIKAKAKRLKQQYKFTNLCT